MILDSSMLDRRWVVSVDDPAIDKSASNLPGYFQEGYPANWSDYIVPLPGCSPVLWQMRPLDSDERTACRAGNEGYRPDGTYWKNIRQMNFEAFCRALTGWQGLRERKEGRIFEVTPVFITKDDRDILKAELVKRLSVWIDPVIQELGALALRSTVLGEVEKN
jgi:hypothetical protein